MTVPTNQIHNGYNNILSYLLERDDKIAFSRGDPQEWLETAGCLKQPFLGS
jgi:hypothetical protein